MTIRVHPPGDWSSFLLGHWQLDRLVREHPSGTEYTFSGSAEVVSTGAGELKWAESGTLRGNGVELEALRTMRFVVHDETHTALHLADGDLLGVLDLSRGRNHLVHQCGLDRYGATIVTGEAELWTRWRCAGPTKHYVATTRARRLDRGDSR